MSALLILVLLCAAAAGLALALRCEIEESFALLAVVLITGGYVLALVGLLPYAWVLLWGLAALGGVAAAAALLRRHGREVLALAGGLALFAAAGLLVWWMCRGFALTDWDDFSHWGSSLKITCTTGALYTAPGSPDLFKSYPPAAALWEALLMQASGTVYREDLALFFHGLLTVIPLLYPLKAMQRRHFGCKALSFGAMLALVLMIYPRGMQMLGVDVLLGVLTALLLLAEFLPGRTRATTWLQVLACFALCLLKSSGFGLALMVCGAALVHRLLFVAGDPGAPRPGRLLPLAAPLGMLAACLAAKASWAVHLSLMGVAERWQSETSLFAGLMELLQGTAPAYRQALPGQFFDSVFKVKNYGTLLPFAFGWWFAIVALLGVAAWLLTRPGQRRPVVLGFASVLVIGALYVVSLLVTYLFFFQEGEATALASISRYLTTCGVLMGLTAIGLTCTAAERRGLPARLLPALLLAAALCLVSHPKYLVSFLQEAPVRAAQSNHDAYLARRAAQRINSLGEENPRLYLITANDAGIAQLRIRYELLPQAIPDAGTILMTEGDALDPWVKQCTWQEWRTELLDGYDYVYIYCPEDQFVREFLPVFIDESQVVVDRMFRVVDTGKDAILQTMPDITADPEPVV